MQRKVVVTGIGPVTAMGNGKAEFFESLRKKKCKIEKIPDEFLAHNKFYTEYYVPCPEVDLSFLGKMKAKVKFAPTCAKLALAATNYAMIDANLSAEEIDRNCGVVFGTGIGNIESCLNVCEDVCESNKYARMMIPQCMINSISGWVSIAFDLHGESYTMNTACASGTSAIGRAYQSIMMGTTDISVCGGVEVLKNHLGIIMYGFDVLGTLTKNKDGMPYIFSNEHNGFLYNEGAASALILEEYEHAVKRNAHIYAEITGYSSNCDAYNIVMMPKDGRMIKNMILDLVQGEKIDYYNAHGTGTQLNDEVETKVFHEIFGTDKSKQPYVSATKGILGHSIGASGAIEAAVCAYSIENNLVHGNIIGHLDEGINLNEEEIHADINTAISVSFGFGGHNAGLKMKKV